MYLIDHVTFKLKFELSRMEDKLKNESIVFKHLVNNII